jgi:hypothetical protein
MYLFVFFGLIAFYLYTNLEGSFQFISENHTKHLYCYIGEKEKKNREENVSTQKYCQETSAWV